MIRTQTADDICTVTLDRPACRNALTPDALEALRNAVETTDASVVYLHGAGEAFCAGADLDVVADLDDESVEAFVRAGQRAATALAETDVVTVAGIDGPARGGGVELALGCDLRVATPAATFAESGVSLGLFGAWGGTARLPRIVGLGEAMDLALTGRVIDADAALRMGLVSRVVEEPREIAETIAAHDPRALQTIKTRLRDTASRADQEDREVEAFASLLKTASFDD
ncbi:enoyl-CoA hydratase/isomerase family protein [Halapricum salinum]|uniref:Enoyl-CoA hydratase/isomerase family protein n=1 Tax=Halapricum salinum TaxID=1457250 RepID=A0A4D6HCZ0_9EURY|nr:enoyl-CoA hydratase/isomerase family protein [Halapricum salinum]QCC51086.1 enoyl-CoA hydratase/isomerase family protein [Halapricum salinum]